MDKGEGGLEGLQTDSEVFLGAVLQLQAGFYDLEGGVGGVRGVGGQ